MLIAAPVLESYTETAWNTDGDGATSTKALASISWNIGDVLVLVAGGEGNENGDSFGAPSNTGTGLSWIQKQLHAAASDCDAGVWAAVATATSSGVISITATGSNTGSDHFGFAVYRFSNSSGVGTGTAEQDTTTKTVSVTTGLAHSALVWGVFDWSAETAHAGTPTPTRTDEASVDSGKYSPHVFELTDQVAAGAVSVGITAGLSTGPYTIVVIEVKGQPVPSSPTIVNQAVQRAAVR